MQQSMMGWLKSMFGAGSGNGADGNASKTRLLSSDNGSGAVAGNAAGGGPGAAGGGPGAAGAAGAAGAGAVAGAGGAGMLRRLRNNDDLENQNYGAASQGRRVHDNDDGTNDFEYRGVTNSNNLDSVFRSSGNATNSNTNNSATNARNSYQAKSSTRTSSMSGGADSTNGFLFDPQASPVQNNVAASHNDSTRMNSYGHPLANARDFNFDEDQPFSDSAAAELPYPETARTTSKSSNRKHGGAQNSLPSSNYDSDEAQSTSNSSFHPSDYDDESFILPGDETYIPLAQSDYNNPSSSRSAAPPGPSQHQNQNQHQYQQVPQYGQPHPSNAQFYNDRYRTSSAGSGATENTAGVETLGRPEVASGAGDGTNRSLSRFQEDVS
ncbi:uncharacterized protein LODBEIA_P06420 [Lodderomyces beijingensis]|uniref:Uncharacterized protein n=1 Tax=Lodderomyces beijingensis TaxID=1775926 RepID=A0ABP0ZE20_9ASCO